MIDRELLRERISLRQANRLVWIIGWFKILLIGLVRPRIVSLDTDKVVVRIPLNRVTRNHFKSMYFGALSIGADLAGGFMAFYFARITDTPVSLVFSHVNGSFHRRPDRAVLFVCENGQQILDMLDEAVTSGERITRPVTVRAFLEGGESDAEPVATFELGLSLKKR
jgi:hypothetical protein